MNLDDSTSGSYKRIDTDRRSYLRQPTKRKIYEEAENLIEFSSSPLGDDENVGGLSNKHTSKSVRDILNDMDLDPKGRSTKSNWTDTSEGFEDEAKVSMNSEMKLKAYIAQLIEKEFPEKTNIPTAADVINVGVACNEHRARYKPGNWVEIEGPDMKWRLDMITRVVKKAPDDFDWNAPENEEVEPAWLYFYHAGSDRKFREEDIRSPEEGLKRIFGNRPWIWQQWAMLKLEEKLRFQEGHQLDLMEMDVQKFGADLWELWLENPANKEFSDVFYDDKRVGTFGRNELINHIQKPFHLIDRIKEDKEEWGFNDDANISAFTYISLLGAGSLMPIVIFFLQITTPFVLVWEVYSKDACADKEDNFRRAKYMALIVYILYIFTVYPDTLWRTYEVEGSAPCAYSRLLSLRKELWVQGDDSLTQMIGYKLDIFMSTAFETLLLMLNVYVVMNTIDDPISILLDALAFIFVAKIDEEIVKSSWWDPDNRWLTAGAMEVVMQSTVRFRSMASVEAFSNKYDIPQEELRKACDDSPTLLKDLNVADDDAENPEYLTKEERILQIFKEVSKDTGNRSAIEEYEKPKVYFGIAETIMGSLGSANPVFNNFQAYRTWSRWNKVLYLAPVPNLNELFEVDKNGNHVLHRKLYNIEPTRNIKFANYYPSEEGLSRVHLFSRNLMDNLRNDLPRGLSNSLRVGQDKKLFRVIFHFIDAFFRVVSYIFQIAFPVFLCYAVYNAVYQIVTQECRQFLDFLRAVNF